MLRRIPALCALFLIGAVTAAGCGDGDETMEPGARGGGSGTAGESGSSGSSGKGGSNGEGGTKGGTAGTGRGGDTSMGGEGGEPSGGTGGELGGAGGEETGGTQTGGTSGSGGMAGGGMAGRGGMAGGGMSSGGQAGGGAAGRANGGAGMANGGSGVAGGGTANGGGGQAGGGMANGGMSGGGQAGGGMASGGMSGGGQAGGGQAGGGQAGGGQAGGGQAGGGQAGGGQAGGGQAGAGGASGSAGQGGGGGVVQIAKQCKFECGDSTDCGDMYGGALDECNPDNSLCEKPLSVCQDNEDCIPVTSGWTATCDVTCTGGRVCVDVLGVGRCAIPVGGGCATGTEPQPWPRHGASGEVTVCQDVSGRCDRGLCKANCATAGCAASPDLGDRCMPTGLCGCNTSADCTGDGVSVCNTSAHVCECAGNQDCANVGGADVCVSGHCGCSDASVCDDVNIYASATPVCQ